MIACQTGKLSQAPQITFLDGGRGLDFNADQVPSRVFNDHINLDFVGIGLHFLDAFGYSAHDLMQLALEARLGTKPSHDQVVNLLYTQLMGQAPSAEVRQGFVSLLDSGTHTIASLGNIAANTDINRTNIDLVGLAKTGLAYLPFEG